MKTQIIIFMLLLTSLVANAKVEVSNEALRDLYIREASVWEKPKWITSDFKFNSKLDIEKGPKLPGRLDEYKKDDVYCIFDEEYANKKTSGKTPKFFCQLLDTDERNAFHRVFKKSGKKQTIKVKYGVKNAEVFSEVVGTRLLWSLGFYADKVFLVDKVFCLGCPENPFENSFVDLSASIRPRLFSPTAIEHKFGGEEIIYIGPNKKIHESGWTIKEFTKKLSEFDDEKFKTQKMQRDALRLLAAVMGHSDSKADNHRLVCDTKKNSGGYCDGDIKMLIHDIGASFGHTSLKSIIATRKASKLDFKRWKKRKVWSDPKKCIPNVGLLREHASYYKEPVTEEGRQFLVKLLKGFSEGKKGRERVLALFKVAQIDLYSHTAFDWANVFLQKINNVSLPMGKESASFRCP